MTFALNTLYDWMCCIGCELETLAVPTVASVSKIRCNTTQTVIYPLDSNRHQDDKRNNKVRFHKIYLVKIKYLSIKNHITVNLQIIVFLIV